MSMHLAAYLIFALAMLACGLSTGAQAYYLVALALFALLILSLISAAWALFTVRVEMKGVKPRVERGETLMTIFTVRHRSLLPVSAVRLRLSVP